MRVSARSGGSHEIIVAAGPTAIPRQRVSRRRTPRGRGLRRSPNGPERNPTGLGTAHASKEGRPGNRGPGARAGGRSAPDRTETAHKRLRRGEPERARYLGLPSRVDVTDSRYW